MKTLLLMVLLTTPLLAQTVGLQVISSSNSPVSITGSATCNGGVESGTITFTNVAQQPIMALFVTATTHCITGGVPNVYTHDRYWKAAPVAVGKSFLMPLDFNSNGTPETPPAPVTVQVQAVQFADGTWWNGGDPSFPATVQAKRTAIRNFLQQLTEATADADFNSLLSQYRLDKQVRFIVMAIQDAQQQSGITSARAKAEDYLTNGNSHSF